MRWGLIGTNFAYFMKREREYFCQYPHRGGVIMKLLRSLTALAAACCALVSATNSHAAIDVGGPINTETWTANYSPYRVSDTVFVRSGQTLTIESGVDVLFDNDVPFIIEGTLVTVGTSDDSVRFMAGNADSWGGMIIVAGKASQLLYTRISDGHPVSPSGVVETPDLTLGGGLTTLGDGTEVSLQNCSITGNRSTSGGGILVKYGSTAHLMDCRVAGNIADGYGAGVDVYDATLVLTRTVIEDNHHGLPSSTGYNEGGGMTGWRAEVQMHDCIVRDNSCRGGGGAGIRLYESRINMERTIVTGNTTNAAGGAMWFSDGCDVSITNCTVTDNSAMTFGGIGLHASTAVIKNSIIWNNQSDNLAALSGGTVLVSYSDVGGENPLTVEHDPWPGVGNINTSPLFMDAANDDYRLVSASPCVDSGDPSPPNDLDGSPSDMGALAYTGGSIGGPTFVSGIIPSSSWNSEGSPYRVNGTITVPTGATLRIQPGVDVLFDTDVQFIVNGALIAEGTENDSIRFIKGESLRWKGLRVLYGGQATLAYTRISDGYTIGPDHLIADQFNDPHDAYGGGICAVSAGTRLDVSNSVISRNEAHGGGGIHISANAKATMRDTEIRDNRSMIAGGVSHSWGAETTFERCIIKNNDATIRGGGGFVFWSSGPVRIRECEIVDNTCAWNGGGVRAMFESPVVFQNTLIARNTSDRTGGGVWASDNTDLTFTNCTITGNKGPETGGVGVWSSQATLKNTIVWGNENIDLTVTMGGTSEVTYSDIGSEYAGKPSINPGTYLVETQRMSWPGEGNISSDPLFVDASGGDYHLAANSPCVDAGDPTVSDADESRSDMGIYGGTGSVIVVPPPPIETVLASGIWTASSSPYRIVANTLVPSGNTLTIEPGVDVLFDVDASFIVQGTLNAIGTEKDSIRFAPGESAEWRGLRVIGAGASAEIAYASIRGGHARGTPESGLANGGGIAVAEESALDLRHSILRDNRAEWIGGAMAIWSDSRVTISDCNIDDNSANAGGGGMFIASLAQVEVTNTRIRGNEGTHGMPWGCTGGVYIRDAAVTFTGCEITNNVSAVTGGGIMIDEESDVSITNCTISDNSSPIGYGGYYGGGLIIRDSQPHSSGKQNAVRVSNTIVQNNVPDDVTVVGEVVDLEMSYSNTNIIYLDGAQYVSGTGNIDIDPMFRDPIRDDYRLAVGSPCIDTGDPDLLDPDGTRLDMGAYGGGSNDESGTEVSGTISTTTWTTSMSPYRVIGEVSVPVGETLTIGPGVDVLFDVDVEFKVEGMIRAIGTDSDSIRFIPGLAASWKRLSIFNSSESNELRYVRVSGAMTNTAAYGIMVVGSELDISNCVLQKNNGGIAMVSASNVRVIRCTMLDNLSDSPGQTNGGGVGIDGSVVLLEDCVIKQNISPAHGGGVRISTDGGPSTVRLQGCEIVDNTSMSYAGGVCVWDDVEITIDRCTITGNTGHDGNTPGGGVFTSSSNMSMSNSIVWGNTPNEIDVFQTDSPSITYSDIKGGFLGTGNIDADPMFANASGSDYRLAEGSPCMDAGDPDLLDPDGTQLDMGAYGGGADVEPTGYAGNISGVWDADSSPYHVTGAIIVPEGKTLTIKPGVDIIFDADVEFRVEGILTAVGTAQDSIRFILGAANRWWGLRLFAGINTLEYVRISGGHARALFENDSVNHHGGGINIQYEGTKLNARHVVVSDNYADGEAGGISIGQGASIEMEDSRIVRNIGGNGGGVTSGVESPRVILRRTVIADNSASNRGGGLNFSNNCVATIENCTIAGNYAPARGSGIHAKFGASVEIISSIVWGNSGSDQVNISENGIGVAHYSNVSGVGYTGAHNIGVDPMFHDISEGDYQLSEDSPCIDTGDPDSPRDPDGTRSDMGALFYNQGDPSGNTDEWLALPSIAPMPGNDVTLSIRARFDLTDAVDMAFVTNTDFLVPSEDLVAWHVFTDMPDVQIESNVVGDTVFVSLFSTSSISLDDEILIQLSFQVDEDVAHGTEIPLEWVGNLTNVGERSVLLFDGEARVRDFIWGDVSGDGYLSMYDASLVLQYLVRLIPDINTLAAEVTGNGYISSSDAAEIARKVVDPQDGFVVETAGWSANRTAARPALFWRETANGWSLNATDQGIVTSASLAFDVSGLPTMDVLGPSMLAVNRDDDILRVAFIHSGALDAPLLLITGDLHAPPHIVSAEVNEVSLSTDEFPVPLRFELAQNTPNPFNPKTTIRFRVPESMPVHLDVYDAMGRKVQTLVDGRAMSAGTYEITWDGRDSGGRAMATGVYIYRISTPTQTVARRMVLLR
jgi:hypothetical protein